MSNRNGFLLCNKPQGMTSFDVVRRMRTIFDCKKIGHAGTLDPHAEGLLILAFGPATRLLQFLTTEPKEYEFILQFGAQTDSLDPDGVMIRTDGTIPETDAVTAVIPSFIGTQMQAPPGFSALKIGGVRAYELARRGQQPQLQARPVTIYNLSLTNYDPLSGRATCTVSCSGGMYVRALARDIAEKLGTVGYALSIRRTSCGSFTLARALRPEQVTASTPLIPPRRAFADSPCCEADDAVLQRIVFGKDIILPHACPRTCQRVMLFHGEELVAVLVRADEQVFHPVKVFIVPKGTINAVA